MTLRILALDHYFGQDLEALEDQTGIQVRRVPFERWRRPALRILGDAVGTGLAQFTLPELAHGRERFSAWLGRDLRRLYIEQAFDVVVVPSDNFFYVRALPRAAHALGIPVVVVQKETTISPATMRDHSQSVARYAPFISDRMTVCSERQREFWIRAGANERKIVVTGQPRFDRYANTSPVLADVSRTVLFLSYELDAYQPGVGGGMGLRTWDRLRSATENVLLRVARMPGWRVVIKAHPQQDRTSERERLIRLAGECWGGSFAIADPEEDVRTLLRAAGCVVGFQTTALYESVAAGLRTIYAAWGPEYERSRSGLIPFEEAPASCLLHASSPEELERMVLSGAGPAQGAACRHWFEEALGAVDGKAAKRVISILAEVADEWPPAAPRMRLDARRSWLAIPLLAEATAVEGVWAAARLPARLAGHEAGVRARGREAAKHRRLAVQALSNGWRKVGRHWF